MSGTLTAAEQPMWGGARERAGQLLGSAAGAMSGLLRRASSWWRKRRREGDDAGDHEHEDRKKARQGTGDG